MPSLDMKKAMLVPRLLHEAKKMRRLMGLSKPRPSRNVEMMKTTPRREKAEVTRSVMERVSSRLGVNGSGAMVSGLRSIAHWQDVAGSIDIRFFFPFLLHVEEEMDSKRTLQACSTLVYVQDKVNHQRQSQHA